MIRSEQAKTYAVGRPESLWETRAPNPLTHPFFFIRRGFEWSGAGAMKKEHRIALRARR